MITYDLIIIGGGPAGIAAGIYAARQKLNTLLITKSFGGQITRKTVGIENYPGFEKISGLDLIGKFEKHLRKQKIDIERDVVKSVKKIGEEFFVLTGSRRHFQAKAIIIASGADPRPLEVPGEKKFIGKGVSYCTTCDGPLFSNKTVAVVYQTSKTNKVNSLKVNGIFVEIGSQPATSFVKGLVNFNEKDEIIIGLGTMQTKTPGLYAAGDVSNVLSKQVVIAAGEGAKAALCASWYIQKNGWDKKS